ncbi:hypothetical protein MKL09_21880 [Methylobacterium sp. J-048]|uniref:hypothetical protein n=1 Tax=Methylobacterium sp. J-048 TaxID=2836635 RepID=UPI001FBAE695|nr:hypothetical protein [Methylobacterium sp. J-048]MCJ2059178.1 hypothetical protein [Methylobacterium sp. J-048]
MKVTTRAPAQCSRLGRLLALGQLLVERAADHARIGRLGVAQLAGLVHLLTGEAQVGDGSPHVPVRNMSGVLPLDSHFAPLLRGVVLIREPALGLRFDLRGVSRVLAGSGSWGH